MDEVESFESSVLPTLEALIERGRRGDESALPELSFSWRIRLGVITSPSD